MHGTDPASQRRQLAARAVAALAASPRSVASHGAAATLAELPVWSLPRAPCLTVPPRVTGDTAAAHLHRAALPSGHVVGVMPTRRTSAARTVVDLAREKGIEDAVVAGDAALARAMTDPDALTRCVQDCAGWPGVRRARHSLELLDGRAESPLESVSRLRLGAAGLPMPDLQPDILSSSSGFWLGRVDFYWDEFGVVGEADGRTKYDIKYDPNDPRQLSEVLWEEKLRQERLERAGLIVVRWGAADLREFKSVVARIRDAYRRGARRPIDERRWVARPSTLCPAGAR
jgi:hypothetical protein